jgi:hypothetical protein
LRLRAGAPRLVLVPDGTRQPSAEVGGGLITVQVTGEEWEHMAFTYMQGDRGQRNSWLFNYTCTEISGRARTKAAALLEEERGIERALVACVSGAAYSGREEDVGRLRKRLREKGEERERCELLARELARAGEQVVQLGLGDLVYFNMDEGISDPTVAPMPGADLSSSDDD